MKVTVTGASGHFGNCLVRELKKQGADIKEYPEYSKERKAIIPCVI